MFAKQHWYVVAMADEVTDAPLGRRVVDEPIVLYRAITSPGETPSEALVLEDRVSYTGAAPWPEEAAGGGAALTRVNLLASGDDPANWGASVRPVDVEDLPEIPLDAFVLEPVYPNPATSRAVVSLRVGETQHVRVLVFDVLGRQVLRVHDGLLPGTALHAFDVDLTALASGLYLVRAVGERAEDVSSVTVVR